MVIDAIYGSEVNEQNLNELARHGDVLIEACGMKYPIACTLFGDSGEQLAAWPLGGCADTVSSYDTIEERWARSTGGVTLRLESADGQIGEVALIIGAEHSPPK
jgi:hypothetical protein